MTMKDQPKYSNAFVQLSGEDGNAFFIMERTATALNSAGASKEEISEYRSACMAGDYDELLRTTMAWVQTR